MCWSGEASLAVAVIDVAVVGYAVVKKEEMALWLPLAYFALMEILQAVTYLVIDDCQNPANQLATLLGYYHIVFQPFVINMLSLYFIPENIRRRISFAVYTACFIATIIMLVKIYPFAWAGKCHLDNILCGAELCSVSGNWHIAWHVPLNGIGNLFTHQFFGLSDTVYVADISIYAYDIVSFVLPLIYGSWKLTIYLFMLGPFLSRLTTDDLNEWPAIWCLFSGAMLLIVARSSIREKLHVKRWWWSLNKPSS